MVYRRSKAAFGAKTLDAVRPSVVPCSPSRELTGGRIAPKRLLGTYDTRGCIDLRAQVAIIRATRRNKVLAATQERLMEAMAATSHAPWNLKMELRLSMWC